MFKILYRLLFVLFLLPSLAAFGGFYSINREGERTALFIKKSDFRFAAGRENQGKKVVSREILQPILLEYCRDDAYLEKFVLRFPFDGYDVYPVEGDERFYVEKNSNDLMKAGWIRNGIRWEKHIHEKLVAYTKPGSVAIDVGGHIGTHTVSLSRLVGESGKVVAFEPQIKLFSELVINMYLNDCKNVELHRLALGSEEKEVEMCPPNEGNEGNMWVGKGGDKVRMVPLDSFNLQNVSIIKIDVEGYEREVIKGARETILRNKPVLLVEIWGGLAQNETIKEIVELGYKVHRLWGHGNDDFLFLPKK